MTNKTLSYLNGKVWYRLLKVIYIFLFVVVAGIAVSVTFYQSKPLKLINNEDSYILCNNGNRLGLEENNIYLLSSYIPYDNEQKIKILCGRNPSNPSKFLSISEVERLEYGPANYELVAFYKYEGSVTKPYIFSLFALLITSAVFELFRRLFYYIVLGTAKPIK